MAGRMRLAFVAALAAMPPACTSADKDGGEEAVGADTRKDKAGGKTPDAEAAAVVASGPDPCLGLPKVDPEAPLYLPGKSVVLTRLLKTCTTRDGKKGIEKDTPWLAMGFPCTAGGGRIDVKGNQNAPKMVTFVIGTDCGMSPSGKDVVKKLFVDEAGMPAESKLMAYNPFAVQYWEVPGMPDADAGFAIELRSAPAIEGAWKRVRDKDKLRVTLYGRENAWVRGDHAYKVEADLHMASPGSFTLDVVSVHALKKEEMAEVKKRCEALRIGKGCTDLF